MSATRDASAPEVFADPGDAALFERLKGARERLAGVAHRTPVMTSRTLDSLTGATIGFKCENLQRGGAFKFRGAYHTISRLPDAVRRRGVIAFSSGNHAQAVALVARLHGVPATIVMPSFAPAAKLAATRGYGAQLVHYDVLGEPRDALAARLAQENGWALIPPFDHPDIVTGQGTAAAELVEDFGPLDVLIAPVGGGGLLSGSALAVHAVHPACRVIGVEPDAGNDGCDSFRTGRLVRREAGATIADGACTPSLGTLTFSILQRHAHELVSVPDSALIDAMRLVWERMKLVVEPTAVLGLAALLTGKVRAEGKRVGIILSGGNVDTTRVGDWLKTS